MPKGNKRENQIQNHNIERASLNNNTPKYNI